MSGRHLLPSVVGNVLSHYEAALFGWVAPILAPLLFPEKSALEALIFTYALLPLSYLAKPVGAVFWGLLGDRIGRKRVLMYTLFGGAFATLGMAILPLGPWMMAGFLFLKSLQKFFYAGEQKGGAIYLLDHTKEKRFFWGSFYDAVGMLGIVLAASFVQLFGKEHWRLLFVFGSFTAFVGVWLRHKGKEAADFQPARFSFAALRQAKGPFLRIFLASGFSYLNYNLITVFLNGYLPFVAKVSVEEALWINTHLLWMDIALLFFFGWLSLKVNPQRLMQWAAILIALFALPLFALLQGASFYEVLFIRLFFITLGVAFAAPYHAWAYEMAPKAHRFFIGSLASSLGGALLGSTAPLIATCLTTFSGQSAIIGLPLFIVGLAAAFVTSGASLRSRNKTLTNCPVG